MLSFRRGEGQSRALPFPLAPWLALALLFMTGPRAPGQDYASQPLLDKTNFVYLGAFALPTGLVGDSYFNYGGHALCPYFDEATGKYTIFMEGHAWYPGEVAQVEIPDRIVNSQDWNDLPLATVLQPFSNATDGKLDTLGDSGAFIYGMLAYHGRLITAASVYYDADNSQVNSHGAASFDLALTNAFHGFYPFNAVASPRSLGRYMTLIPAEWQAAFGGPALSGQCCICIIENSSSGPAATVFDPDDVGTKDPIPGTTVLYYPVNQPLAPGDTQNSLYNYATQMGGMAFPPGSRSVLFIGRQGLGPYCYGIGSDCGDPADDSKGTHAYPYQHQVWAYDANDLVAVKNGRKLPWEVRPYATWSLDDMDTSGGAAIRSAGYDPLTGRLYIAQAFGDDPRIDVYQLAVPSPTTLRILIQSDRHLQLQVSAGPNLLCELDASPDLVHWTTVFSGQSDATGHLAYAPTNLPIQSSQFYRARLTAP
jgi:hypothetical protein